MNQQDLSNRVFNMLTIMGGSIVGLILGIAINATIFYWLSLPATLMSFLLTDWVRLMCVMIGMLCFAFGAVLPTFPRYWLFPPNSRFRLFEGVLLCGAGLGTVIFHIFYYN